MKSIIKIKTDDRHEQYYGTLINDHLINSGDPLVDWIDTQLYINEHNLTDVEEDETVVYFSILSPWGCADVDGIQMMVPHSMEYAALACKMTQNFNRAHPLRDSDGGFSKLKEDDGEFKNARISKRKRNSTKI